jgi:hypothetical protein
MHVLWLVCLGLCPAAAGGQLAGVKPADAAAVAFEFHDAATYEGRSVLHFRNLDLRDKPDRPLAADVQAPRGVRYAMLPIGPTRETALSLLWIPTAVGGPALWLDANRDGRFTADEKHVFTAKQLEITLPIPTESKPKGKTVSRTLIFRRSSLGDGLRYAVRGYALGSLEFAGAKRKVLIEDGNADGLLSTIGQDRVLVDLDGDGRFDPVLEQFPLGKPIAKDGQVFVIRCDPAATAVVARRRSGLEGKLRLDLAGAAKVHNVAVELVSDLGELVVVEQLGKSIVVPAGDYYITAVRLELADAAGKIWSYAFFDREQPTFPVPAGTEKRVALLDKLAMEVDANSSHGGRMKPSESMYITPHLHAAAGLELSSCRIGSGMFSVPTEDGAEIVLRSPEGKVLSHGVSGFG